MAAWAPARYVAGPTPAGRKSLGVLGLSWNFDRTTVLAAAAGGAGILLSDAFFDPPVNLLVKIGGFAAVGYSVYHLLGLDLPEGGATSDTGPGAGIKSPVKAYPDGTGAAEAAADAAAIAAARAKAAADAGGNPLPSGDPLAVSGEITNPPGSDGKTPDFGGFWSHTEYDVAFRLTNYSPGPVTALVEYRVAYYTKGLAEVRSKRFTVTVPPLYGDQAGTLDYKGTVKADYNPEADHAVAVLYIGGRVISPPAKYEL